MAGPQTTGELDYNRLWSEKSEDKSSEMSIGVFNGTPSITVFSSNRGNGGGGGPLVRYTMRQKSLSMLIHLLLKIKSASPGTKAEIAISEYDMENKKSVPQGSIVIGRDDKNLAYIGITNKNLSPPQKYPLRMELRWDTSSYMTPAELSNIAIDDLISTLKTNVVIAMMATKFKRAAGQGQRPGGNYQPRTQNNTAPMDDDIPF